MKDELAVQEDKWEHREEEKAEIERKREEIRILEEEYERERSLSRRRNMEIVHEDLMDQHPEEEKKSIIDTRGNRSARRMSSLSPGAWEPDQDIQLVDVRKTEAQLIKDPSVEDPTAEIEQLSYWSESQMHHALSQRDAQNP